MNLKERIDSAADPGELRKLALYKCGELLKGQDYTEQRLLRKLTESGFPEDTAREAVSAMAEAHYIDDRRYSENYVALHLRDRSRKRIEQELYERGIAEDLIEAAFRHAECGDTGKEGESGEESGSIAGMEYRQIRRLLDKRGFDPRTATWEERQKIMASLYRKGYPQDLIRRAMEPQ
ncbi:MAG: recombination regulator RecX [Lachnospiraceae bacterium]|nr:recombination regulator RecX [Lachnospiraceae bacterium]